MIVVCTDRDAQAAHAPEQEFAGGELSPYPECPRRYEVIRAALEAASWARRVDPRGAGDEVLASVHDADYLGFLQGTCRNLRRSRRELAPSVFAHPDGRRPTKGRASLGFYGFDTTPVTTGTWAAARAAADAALTAADLVADGERAVYALCRPPGHHAGPATFGGYCYLNHAALAARRLARHGRVAVIDLDYHHGNGTQRIFWESGDVFFLSLHADPVFEYPCYWGYADETGVGQGAGTTRNVPLPAGVEGSWYLDELRRALEDVAAFDPSYAVISVGFDTYADDPLGTFRLDATAIGRVGVALAALARPTVVVQEGG